MRTIAYWEFKVEAALIEISLLKAKLKTFGPIREARKWIRLPNGVRRRATSKKLFHTYRLRAIIKHSRRRQLENRLHMLENTKLPYYLAQIDQKLPTLWERLLEEDVPGFA